MWADLLAALVVDVADVEGLGIPQVIGVPCRAVHPGGRPQQLVVDAGAVVVRDGRAVELLRGGEAHGDGVGALQVLGVLVLAG